MLLFLLPRNALELKTDQINRLYGIEGNGFCQ